MTTNSNLQILLREGIAAAKAAHQKPASQSGQPVHPNPTTQREKARQLLLRVTELDEHNIPGWLWLSTVMDTLEEQRICLDNVLTLDPDNQPAQAGLARLDQLAALPAKDRRPPTPDNIASRNPQATGEPNSTSPPPPAAGNDVPHSQGPTSRYARLKSRPVAEQAANSPQAAPAKSSGNLCPFCQKAVSGMATSCPHCQLPLAMTCPACGTAVDVEQKTCRQCSQAMGHYRQGVTYFARLGAAYQAHEQYEAALKAWQAVELLKPDSPELQLRLGEAQQGLGRPDRAEANFQRELEQHPKSPQAHFAMGELLRQRGERQEAFTYFYQVTQLDSKHGLAWLRMGQLYEQVRRQQEAAQAYKRAAALLKSDSPESRQARGQLAQLQPGLPVAMATGWAELIRQMTGLVFICLLAALLDAGLRPWWLDWTGWLALFLAPLGAFLWLSGTSLPHNPLIRLLIGEKNLPSAEVRLPLAVLGAGCWLLALSLILLPLGGQSLPELPPLPS
jgi:Flp pilus assembly protein TadD